MQLWIAVAQAVAAMDAVRRRWAREHGLDAAELMLVILLAPGPTSASQLAVWSGRPRQVVQRSLQAMESNGVVCVHRRSRDGKAQAWSLTEEGVHFAREFERHAQAWEDLLGERPVGPDVASVSLGGVGGSRAGP